MNPTDTEEEIAPPTPGQIIKACSSCSGTGEVIEYNVRVTCAMCDGDGTVEEGA